MMTTAKNEAFITLLHEKCYFWGGIKICGAESTGEDFSRWKGDEQISGSWGGSSHIPTVGKTLD